MPKTIHRIVTARASAKPHSSGIGKSGCRRIPSPHSPPDDGVTFKQHIYYLGSLEFPVTTLVCTFQAEGNGRAVDGCSRLGPAVTLFWYIAFSKSLGKGCNPDFSHVNKDSLVDRLTRCNCYYRTILHAILIVFAYNDSTTFSTWASVSIAAPYVSSTSGSSKTNRRPFPWSSTP